MGKKIYLDTYYPLYLMAGHFLGREDFGAMAEWIYRDCRRRGTWPDGVEWLLLLPQMDGFGAQAPFAPPFLRYDRLFEHSDIARVRRGGFSLTLMRGSPTSCTSKAARCLCTWRSIRTCATSATLSLEDAAAHRARLPPERARAGVVTISRLTKSRRPATGGAWTTPPARA